MHQQNVVTRAEFDGLNEVLVGGRRCRRVVRIIQVEDLCALDEIGREIFKRYENGF